MAKKLFSAIFVAFFVLNSFWAKNSCDPYELFSYAADLLEEGKYKASIKASEKAASYFKNFSAYENGETFYYDCLTQIGEAYLRMGNAKRAQIQFQQTFDLAPQNMDTLLGIAAVYIRLQKYSEGKEFFEAAIKKYKGASATPNTAAIVAPLYHYYAVCLSGENNFEHALYAIQASQENYLRAGKTVPPEVKRFNEQVVKNLNEQENGTK